MALRLWRERGCHGSSQAPAGLAFECLCLCFPNLDAEVFDERLFRFRGSSPLDACSRQAGQFVQVVALLFLS